MAAVPAGLAHALKDRYRLDRELGQGGMATVYLAHDLKHDRDVAITEAPITELDKVSALTVTSRTSAMSFKGSHERLPMIARQLNVEGIVEGSVLREGGRVRISARLIDARTDRHLWDSTYEREAASVLGLQAEVGRTIAGAIGATLTPDETRRLQVRRPVTPDAYDEYLLGRHQLTHVTAEGCERAIAHYRRAIALDPGSALAHAALAQISSFFEWRWDEADGEYRRALELNPGLSDVHFWYSTLLTVLGRHDEAVGHALRAVALDPLRANVSALPGVAYFYAGRFQESIAANQRALEVNRAFSGAHMMLAWTYSPVGRQREAIEAVDGAPRDDPENQQVLGSAVVVYARAGRLAVARRYLDSLLAIGGRPGSWVDPYNVGQAYAFLGETDRALQSFDRAIEERSVLVGWLRTEWLPEGFKADPRFHALLQRVNLE